MEIKSLPNEVNERIRSDNKIINFCQCVLELIFNSLDAKATSIAVRINIEDHKVQIVDNGIGIHLNDLQSVGVRYMTTKCDSLYAYENKHNHYGYKGEAIASILCASQKLIITTRYCTEELTYSKTFENGYFVNTIPVKPRSSKGTTVTVLGFFFNCPVKQNRINSSVDLNNIKTVFKTLAVIHPTVSFSLRDDNTGKILLNCFKTTTVSRSLYMLYGDIASEDLIEVKISKNNIHVSGLIYTKSYKNSKPQLIYVNRRSAHIERIEKYVDDILSKTLKDIIPINSYPVFIINISCPYSLIDILFDSINFIVEFKSWEIVMKCVEKVMKLFISKYKKLRIQEKKDNTSDITNNQWHEIQTETENTSISRTYLKTKENMDGRNLFKCQERHLKEKNSLNRIKKRRYLNANLQEKPCKKPLGLKRQKLKKKKDNIFEKSLAISDLSLNINDVPSNLPLRKDKLQKNPNYLKNIFDSQFNSQHLLFDKTKLMPCATNVKVSNLEHLQKVDLPNSFTNKGEIFNNEPSGKEFVMDLFLKSLMPNTQKNVLQKEASKEMKFSMKPEPLTPSKSLESYQYDDTSDISKLNTNASENHNKLHNEVDLTLNAETIKKRRMEKLNHIGTCLIADKLSKLRKNNSDTKTTQTSSTNKKTKSIGTSTNKGVAFKRNNSENKCTQTATLVSECDMVSIGVQTSFGRNLITNFDKKDAENQYEISFQNSRRTQHNSQELGECNPQNNLLFTLPDKSCLIDMKPSEPQIEYLANFENNTEHYIYNNVPGLWNDTTFASHYNCGLPKQAPTLLNSTIIQVNTKNVKTILDNSFSKPNFHREPDVDYRNFKKGLEKLIDNENIQPLYENPTIDIFNMSTEFEESANISRFFTSNALVDNTITTDMKVNRKVNTSALIDTSLFLPKNEDNFDQFKYPSSIQKIKTVCFNQTALSFGKFVPTFKSTQKEKKHCGKDINLFESFTFNEHNKQESNETNADITFTPIMSDRPYDPASINKKIGTFKDEPNFFFKKRIDFIPKGLSPILKQVKTLNMSLSPSSRKKLNNAIVESYENELDLIKWQDYIDKEDPKQFFDKIYEEKRKNIECDIPNGSDVCVENIKKVYSAMQSYTFTKDIFNKLDVLGQLDNKFIVTLSNSTLILLLDQHAIHERIRVEELLEDYTIPNPKNGRIIFKSVECKEYLTINYSNIELQLLDDFKMHFKNIGLQYEVYADLIKITKIPLCFMRKCSKTINSEENLHRFVSNLINDELSILQTTRGIPSYIPTIIQHTINNEACRGAVKFGQKLTHNQCCNYVKNLAKCQLPFQCAHGRPTVHPILELSTSKRHLSCNLKQLK